MVRVPAVAGQFYPGVPEALRHAVDLYVGKPSETKIKAKGCVIPHAGYMYSGRVAGSVYAALELPKRFVILCPNHTGYGEPLAILSEGAWETPLGQAKIDTELADALMDEFALLKEDPDAHEAEHAIEVQLPFLQELLKNDFTFVPITVGTGRREVLMALGVAIAKAITRVSLEALVIASSDMNHYEADDLTRVKDRKAIDRVLALDPAGLYNVVQTEHISMCGYGPTVAMLTAAKNLGAKSAELIQYATSGDVSHDLEHVVGYAGMVVS